MGTITVINPEGVTASELQVFTERLTARAVVFDMNGRIALLHVTHEGYHKLPGGGVEAGEDITESLRRECREEIGCEILIGESLGEIHEYRKQFKQHQISYCFTALVSGDKGIPLFTPAETAGGFELGWFLPEEAGMILASESPTLYVAEYIVLRDRMILSMLPV